MGLLLLEKRSLRADVIVAYNIINDMKKGGNTHCFYSAFLPESEKFG